MKARFYLLSCLFLLISAVPCLAQEPPVAPVPITPVVIDPLALPQNQTQFDPIGKTLPDGTLSPTTEPTEDNSEQTDADKEAQRIEDEDLKIKFDERQSQLPQAKIWGQQFFRDQSIEFFDNYRDKKAIDSYLLGIGDEISVTIWGRTSYSSNTQVEEDGYINLSNPATGIHIPRVYVKDMRFGDVKKAVLSRLRNHMNIDNSQTAINLNYSRAMTINITGEVFNPGSYNMPAINTAFNALVAAGGPSQIGSVRLIKVVSSGQPERILDVYEFINNPKVMEEFFLQSNDYIYVPLAERIIEISGAIERPFYYELVGDENLLELITHAGGLRPDAYKKNIQVIRYENDEEKLIDVDLTALYQAGKNFEVKDGDRITINQIGQAFANYATVKGAVRLPGTYEIKPTTTISEVLRKSGIIRSAIMQKIYIKRLREDLSIDYIPVNIYDVLDNENSSENLTLRPFDEIEVKYKADFIDKYNVKIYGSVRQPGNFEYSDSLLLEDVIYMANGIQLDATNSIVEISRLVIDDKGSKTFIVFEQFKINDELQIVGADNFVLEPYDQIFVRKSKDFQIPQNISIGGEILLPGLYTMKDKTERVMSVLERAGGVTPAAFLEGAKLFRKGEGLVLLDLNKLLKEGEKSKFNYVLKPGDRIIIPTHKELVSIAGRINHPTIKEGAEIEMMERDLELEKLDTKIGKQEYLLAREIEKVDNPTKVNIPFHEGKNALFYIKEYGAGIDRKLGGRNRLVYVKYANGAVKKTKSFLFFKTYPKVDKGAMVYVDEKQVKPKNPNKNPVDWYKVVRDGFAIVTSGLTLYALITALQR